MNFMKKLQVVVLGGGISGCMCAWRLSKMGHLCTVVEKGRGVGGRMATRRMNGARIDHGAQFFTVRNERMLDLVEKMQQEQIITQWYDRVHGRDDLGVSVRFRGVSGMTSMPKYLAKSFSSEINFFVEHVKRVEDGWLIKERDGSTRSIFADHLVITFPSTQIIELFQRSEFELDADTMERLRRIRHTRCLALLGLLDRPSVLKSPGTCTHPVDEVEWIADNQVKGISEKPSFILHASDAYSQKFWDAPDSERVPFLLSIAEENLRVKITSWASHRWGFAKPIQTFGATFWHSSENRLTLAGDGFGGERVEHAALSGWDAANAICELFDS